MRCLHSILSVRQTKSLLIERERHKEPRYHVKQFKMVQAALRLRAHNRSGHVDVANTFELIFSYAVVTPIYQKETRPIRMTIIRRSRTGV